MNGVDERLQRDPSWYRAKYSIAAHSLHGETGIRHALPLPDEGLKGLMTYLGRGAAAGDAQQAEDLACELLEITRRNLRAAGWRYPRRPPRRIVRWMRSVSRRSGPLGRDPGLAKFLDSTLEPATVVLIWSARVARGKPVPLAYETRPAPAGFVDRTSKDPAWLESYLADLVGERRNYPGAWNSAMLRLGSRRHRLPSKPGYRVRYNLACLYSRQAEARRPRVAYGSLERSAEQLLLAREATGEERRAELLRWAQHDPGLEGLRGGDPKAFRLVVGPPPPASKTVERVPVWRKAPARTSS